jgi:hypothetical protein
MGLDGALYSAVTAVQIRTVVGVRRLLLRVHPFFHPAPQTTKPLQHSKAPGEKHYHK